MRVRELIQDILIVRWPQLLAVVVFMVALIRFWGDGAEVLQARAFYVALIGLITVFAPGEISEWTGSYGWTRDQYHTHSEEFVSFIGWVCLVGGATTLLFV